MNTIFLNENGKTGEASELVVFNCYNCKKGRDGCRPYMGHSETHLGDCFITQFVSSNFEGAKSEIKTIDKQFDIIQHTLNPDRNYPEKIRMLIALLDEQNEGRNRILTNLKHAYQL